jgi:hypothetical protein
MSERKAVIKNADMSEELQQDAIDLAAQAMDKFNVEKDIAACACEIDRAARARRAPPPCAPLAARAHMRPPP